jgi:hypothetical protein
VFDPRLFVLSRDDTDFCGLIPHLRRDQQLFLIKVPGGTLRNDCGPLGISSKTGCVLKNSYRATGYLEIYQKRYISYHIIY